MSEVRVVDKELDRLFKTADFVRDPAHRDALRERLFGKRREDGELDEDELELVAAARKDPEFSKLMAERRDGQ